MRHKHSLDTSCLGKSYQKHHRLRSQDRSLSGLFVTCDKKGMNENSFDAVCLWINRKESHGLPVSSFKGLINNT
jgi:hypothetical protein